jgi:CRISPR system Cascade subunit CasE
MTLKLMHLRPDAVSLTAWAVRNNVLSPDGDDGYALHSLLSNVFGEQAPKPFRHLGGRQGLLAYTLAELESLRLSASLATPDAARALGLDELDARPFPDTWKEGQILGFEVKVRPVIRAKDGRERDVFLHMVEAAFSAGSNENKVMRAEIYRAWLVKQFAAEGAAQIIHAQMEAFCLTRVLRKESARNDGKRKSRAVSGPSVVFKGQLQIGRSAAFTRLLARGVGRHRAFGFGMLLLKPPALC